MIRIAIVEDDHSFAEELAAYLGRYEQTSGVRFAVSRYADGDEITENYTASFDIILMDIQMQFMDGMTAAERIRSLDDEVVIIFITNMENYAIRGYQVDALDYVLKPISYALFESKMERAIRRVNNRKERAISLKTLNGMLRLRIDDIFYIENDGHRLIWHTGKGDISTRQKLSDAETMLQDGSFFRINKGCIVNLKHVDGEQSGDCMVGEDRLPVSRARRGEFFAAMTAYIGNF